MRAVCLEAFVERIPVLKAIADGSFVERRRQPGGTGIEIESSASAGDRIKAVETLGKYGLGSDASLSATAQIETADGVRFTLILGERE